MSRTNLWQICHNHKLGNCYLTKTITRILKNKKLTPKEIANDLKIPTERVRNWYYKDTGLTARDLVILMRRYGFIKNFVIEILD